LAQMRLLCPDLSGEMAGMSEGVVNSLQNSRSAP
jgi:hypothetical protein